MASVSSAAGERRAPSAPDVARDERPGLGRRGQLHLVAGRDQPDAPVAQGDLEVAQQRVHGVARRARRAARSRVGTAAARRRTAALPARRTPTGAPGRRCGVTACRRWRAVGRRPSSVIARGSIGRRLSGPAIGRRQDRAADGSGPTARACSTVSSRPLTSSSIARNVMATTTRSRDAGEQVLEHDLRRADAERCADDRGAVREGDRARHDLGRLVEAAARAASTAPGPATRTPGRAAGAGGERRAGARRRGRHGAARGGTAAPGPRAAPQDALQRPGSGGNR